MTFDELVACIRAALEPQAFDMTERDGLTGYDKAALQIQAEARAGTAEALTQAVIEVSKEGPHDDTDWWLRLLAFLSFQPGLSSVSRNLLVAEFETKVAWSPTVHGYIFRQLSVAGCWFDWNVVRTRPDYGLIAQCSPLVLADAMVRSGASEIASIVLAEACAANVVSLEVVAEQKRRWLEFGHVVPAVERLEAAEDRRAPIPFIDASFFVPEYARVIQPLLAG